MTANVRDFALAMDFSRNTLGSTSFHQAYESDTFPIQIVTGAPDLRPAWQLRDVY